MRRIQRFDIKNIIHHLKTEGWSMRRRFALYIISAFSMIIAVILLLLNALGIMNPTNRQLMELLDSRLLTFTDQIEHNYDEIAAYALSFSEQLETSIQDHLLENNLSFDELRNNTPALTNLQDELYDIVYLNMQLSPSSGAFYLLDTTVNSQSETPLYNGIYLKYINLFSKNTVNNEFSLYRGFFTTGKNHGIIFHSGWQSEMKTNFFQTRSLLFDKGTHYILSSAVDIPDTWERARYIYVPIRDLSDDVIGVCGFEINDLYFQLTHKADDAALGYVVYALLDNQQGHYTGQFNSNRYSIDSSAAFDLTSKNDFSVFRFDTEYCIGKTTAVRLGKDTFTAAIMLTQTQFDQFMRQGKEKFALLLMIVACFAFLCCVLMSKKYVSPILKKIEQIKTNQDYSNPIRISEIDDLFAFLEERDIYYERQLKTLENAKQLAEEEANQSKLAYENAIKKYELALSEITQLGEQHQKNIVLEDYEFFICNLNTLTPTEYRIYELYLAGKNAKQITEMLGITENTLKYHNKNIYSKLGISSRKQLLRFASLKQHQDSKNGTAPS